MTTAGGAPRDAQSRDSANAAAPPLASGGLGRRFAPAEGRCEFCGHPGLDRHCKVVCPRCGAVRDCSDP